MPAAIVHDEDSVFDPDDLKMPESPQHRQTSDLIGLAAANLLGESHQVFRDMNWYPPDGGPAMAPDVLVLPAGAWVPPPGHGPDEQLKSYRQDLTEGPAPVVAVEVPSGSDGFESLVHKLERCRKLGAAVFMVSFHLEQVLRWDTSDEGGPAGPQPWTDRPIPELGWLRISFVDHQALVTLPDGTAATSDVALLAQSQHETAEAQAQAAEAQAQAAEAQAQAAEAQAQAAEAEARAEALARRLRELGHDPDF